MKREGYSKLSILLLILLVFQLFLVLVPSIKSQLFEVPDSLEYQDYVHTYINDGDLGNWTYIEKPFFPVFLNSSKIPIGQNWSIVSPLSANKNYHVYCYGNWVNTSAAAKTDYDIYVYNPQGKLEGEHTEAAGFPEHLGTTVTEALFVPQYSGNYTFVLVNDKRESQGSQQATFMIIEDLETNKWNLHFVEGKNNNNNAEFNTYWTYAFVTNETFLELWIKVPETLDMYEARLYLMNNIDSPSINDYPLPWEPGLYGEISNNVGGINFENEGYRGVSYASCEFRGQDMFINFTSPFSGPNLYYLTLIGEVGSGELSLLFKTRFGDVLLVPDVYQRRVYPGNATEIVYSSNSTDLEDAEMRYTTNNWETFEIIKMEINNRTCSGIISEQEAGVFVQYDIQATDSINNNLLATGNFTVKQGLSINITVDKKEIVLGENVTIEGVITSGDLGIPVNIQLIGSNSTELYKCFTNENGTISLDIKPQFSGLHTIRAIILESDSVYEFFSSDIMIMVEEPPFYVTYAIYIIGGIAGISGISGAIYYIKFRNR